MALFKATTAIKPNTEGADRKNTADKMSQELLAISKKWTMQSKKGETNSLRIYYERCQDVAKVVADPEKYMDEGVDLLLKVHDIDLHQKKLFINVATYIPPAMFEEIVNYNLGDGSDYGVITVGHIQRLAYISDQKIRMQILREIHEEKLSVKSTAERVKEAITKDGSVASTTIIEVKPTDVTKQSIKAVQKFTEAAEQITSDAFLERVCKAKIKDAEATDSQFAECEARMVDLEARVPKVLSAIKLARDKLASRRKLAEAQGNTSNTLHAIAAPKKKKTSKKTDTVTATGVKKKKKKKKRPATAEGDAAAPTTTVKKKKKKRPATTGASGSTKPSTKGTVKKKLARKKVKPGANAEA